VFIVLHLVSINLQRWSWTECESAKKKIWLQSL